MTTAQEQVEDLARRSVKLSRGMREVGREAMVRATVMRAFGDAAQADEVTRSYLLAWFAAQIQLARWDRESLALMDNPEVRIG